MDQLNEQAKGEHTENWQGRWRAPLRDSHLHMWWASLLVVVSFLGAVITVAGLASLTG